MNTDTVINPYELLRIDPHNPDMKMLKKNYYRLVLRHHPDKGGSKKTMRIIQNAYEYIKLQFQNCQNQKSCTQLENEFSLFCKQQEDRAPQFTVDQRGDEHSKRKNFNAEFEKEKKRNVTNFDSGYGELMTGSEYAKGKLAYNKDNIHKKSKHVFKNIDNRALSIYKEPESFLQSYGNHERFDVNTVSDFSYSTGELSMSDYHKAFKIIGEKNIKKVKLKERSLKNYLKQRETDQKTYKVSSGHFPNKTVHKILRGAHARHSLREKYVFKERDYAVNNMSSSSNDETSTEESYDNSSDLD